MSQKYEKLKSLLKELFQLDQPDLDFGLYRIMHAKAAEVTQFLDRDLLPQVKQEFSQYKTADKAELEQQLAKAVEQAQALGADPETLPKVKELRAKIGTDAVDIATLEGEVYDHLISFFSRYYSEGDFLSKRRYSRDGRYAIPYDGEEVKLHWANHDQYYIKTSEYLRDYAFRLNPSNDANPMRVHFRLVDATEGEHGNIKAANGKDRVFILTTGDFASLSDSELSLGFEYRPATLTDWPEEVRSGKTKPPAQKDLTDIAEKRIQAVKETTLLPWIAELVKPHFKADGEKADYSRLRAHLNRYVARNTFDYFIHKDLGGFLRRELDFYIKNEVMQLDDVENETAPRVEQYLSKIKVIRRIAGKVIAFLAQLEDFQKTLWLKKKFVVETQYCVAIKAIPADFNAEIVANTAQLAEWSALYGIVPTNRKARGDSGLFGDDSQLVTLSDQLRVPGSLMIDTRHFESDFTARLLEVLGEIDENTDGILFHSENYQALNLMQAKYNGKMQCLFNDPPYNTGSDGFQYRDAYRHSSWLSMMAAVCSACNELLSSEGVSWFTLDDGEAERFYIAACQWFGEGKAFPRISWQHSIQGKGYDGSISVHHNTILAFRKSADSFLGLLEREDKHNKAYGNSDNDPKGEWRTGDVRNALYRPNLIYPIQTPSGKEILPPENGWRWSKETMQSKIASGEVYFSEDESRIIRKIYLADQEGRVPESIWFGDDVGTSRSATADLKSMFQESPFGTPKPKELISNIIRLSDAFITGDFFAGSGTTGHAVINLNREDGGRRKFVLVEMADYFDTVLLPRLKKIALTPDWKDGKPKRVGTAEEIKGGPRLLKIVRLESYEDTLNNLELKRTAAQQATLDFSQAQGSGKLREQYMLRYMLKVESVDSPSLLNVASFTDPTAYRLVVKRPGSDEAREVCVDLIETFNWLLGLSVQHIAVPQVFSAQFERDTEKRLRVKGRIKNDKSGPFWFRTVTGTMPDGRKVLVIWRKLTGKPEEDNLVLDEWFTKQGYSSKDSEFGLIYVNGGNNLENLKTPDDTWKVRLIEDDFQRLMFATEGN